MTTPADNTTDRLAALAAHAEVLENMKANGFDCGLEEEDYLALDAAISSLRATAQQPVAVDGWVSIDESQPPRNSMAVYWHVSTDGRSGFPAIADEWRDEHHRDCATHWHPGASLAPGVALRSGSQDSEAGSAWTTS